MPEIRLIFEPRDLWIGVFWDTSEKLVPASDGPLSVHMKITKVYICLIPMLPIRLTWTREAIRCQTIA